METPILAKVYRGETLESVHRGHIVVFDGDRKVLYSVGDPTTVTFFRSAAKPFQAIPVLTGGAADHFGFTEEEIALACASHSGEPMHVAIASRMLERCAMKESDLRCGKHLPFSEREAERLLRANESVTQLHNNCSGKHAAMLAFAKHLDADTDTYEQANNPIQRRILEAVALFCEMSIDGIAIGIDGCCAPNFAIPLENMARGFLNLVSPREEFGNEATRDASKRIVNAIVLHPQLIGGTDRMDTILMNAAPGKVISKVGADGVWLCGILPSNQFPKGAAIALKIEDGNDVRARPVVAADLLKRFGLIPKEALSEFSTMFTKNRRGEVVGRVEYCHH